MRKRGINQKQKFLTLIYILIIIFVLFLFFKFSSPIKEVSAWTKTGTVYNCTNCSDCNSAIQNANSGDIVQLNTSINNHTGGNCITFYDRNNITFDCLGNYIEGTGGGYGIFITTFGLGGSSNITIKNCNITSFNTGIRLDAGTIDAAHDNKVINITSSYNKYGIVFYRSSNNTIANSTVQENNYLDFFFYPMTQDYHCNNIITNITSSGGRAIEFYNYTVTIQNKTLSQLILCNADDSIVDNVTIIGSSTQKNNEFQMYRINNSKISNINSSENYRGIFMEQSSNNTLTNITANNNIQPGITLDTSHNNILKNITANNNLGGISIGEASNNTLTNITANYNSQSGIYLQAAHNNTLTNINANSNNESGIHFYLSSNNTIANSTFQENNGSDFYYSVFYFNTFKDYHCDNILTNITGSGNRAIEYYNYTVTIQNKVLSELILCNADDSIVDNVTIIGSATKKNNALWVYRVNNSKISNINSSENYHGIHIFLSSNNTITNITANYNSQSGIYLYSSSNNTLTNITANNNSYGIYFYHNSTYNTLNNSRIGNNAQKGMVFHEWGGWGYPQYNKIYNNYLNNNINYYNTSTLTNYFNTTKTLDTNIMKGSYIGGNYWAYPNGSGFSQTCADSNSDGICDTTYNIDGVNYDYLPLVCIESWSCGAWGACSGGTQTRTCTDSNSCGTTSFKPITSQSCTEPGGGTAAPSQTNSWSQITPSQPATMTITQSGIDLTKITVATSGTVSSASLTVTKVDVSQADLGIGLPTGKVYQAFNITTKNLNDTNTANVTIEFKINKTWLLEQDETSDNVNIYRKIENVWNPWQVLNATLIEEDSNFYYFSAVSSGFSTFMIFLGKYECAIGEKRCLNDQVQLCLGNYTWMITEKCKYGCKDNECVAPTPALKFGSTMFYLVIGLIGGVIIVVVYYIYRSIKRKR